jgi:hypothetical protein
VHSVIRALFSSVQTLRRERDEEQREREARDRAKEEERIYRWADTVQLHSGKKALELLKVGWEKTWIRDSSGEYFLTVLRMR